MADSEASPLEQPAPPAAAAPAVPAESSPSPARKEELLPVGEKISELSDIKSALNNEIEQLRSDFQELRTTLKKQQEDVSLSLQNLGLQDATENDGSKGSGEENTNEDLSANLGNLNLDDASKNHDESRDAKDDKTFHEKNECDIISEIQNGNACRRWGGEPK
ncbi:hypothetical protein BAE44_0015956 [Dichanthelium oligosanthes]|uniref:Uncharacterized protein n=1 Tax=Dichanthelium oligosanthes TaxID=888268 RepID=A0A1E5VD03_9POAL|nr:hypothetical protein BAE44_0015956 [Dichanthelium oligosanthes]